MLFPNTHSRGYSIEILPVENTRDFKAEMWQDWNSNRRQNKNLGLPYLIVSDVQDIDDIEYPLILRKIYRIEHGI